MEKFMQSLYNLVTTWQPLVTMLVAIVLVGIGVMFIIPSKQSKEMAKSALPFVVIGAGIVLLAIVLAKEISGAFAF